MKLTMEIKQKDYIRNELKLKIEMGEKKVTKKTIINDN